MATTLQRPAGIAELPELDISSARFRDEPWTVTRKLDAPDGLARSVRGIEVFGYESARRFFVTPQFEAGVDLIYESSGITDGPLHDHVRRQLANLEGDLHATVRAAVGGYFTRQRVPWMRPLVRDLLRSFMRECERGGACDFNRDVAGRLPSSMVCHVVGAPLEDAPLLRDWSETMMSVFLQDPRLGAQIASTYSELEDYVNALIARRRQAPADDLTSHLLALSGEQKLDEEDVFASVMSVIRAGTDTTQAQITLCVSVLVDHPETWEVVRRDPDAVPAIVAEAIRYRTGVWTHHRVARQSAELLGLKLEAGTRLFASVMVAHRDPSVFAHPDSFDIARTDARRTLNWGLGRHFCIGQSMAALEIEETVRVVAERWRQIRHAGGLVTSGRPYQNLAVSLPLEFEVAAER